MFAPRFWALVSVAAAIACRDVDHYRTGTLFPEALPRPQFVLRGLGGESYDFATNTRGALTVVLFGYTSCPDVCPDNLTVIAGARRLLPPEIRNAIKTVFVSTDPIRDTPAKLAEYLAHFDSGFVGLTGSLDSIELAANRSAIPFLPSDSGAAQKSFEHYSSAIVISPDDSIRLLVPRTASSKEWAADLKTIWKRYPARSR